ncbi:MAG: penicillin-insensitive murein endopeptidase [Deltaproteobacteria bacterium]|jgi:LysM repeat protein|nr:penicillin-insensitive murein endopeptidase [Deltaproteobacteria bacterium]MBW2534189.1 penicillin-insensitive murein endopeptidase [Deltaproteobacteria bacterium]
MVQRSLIAACTALALSLAAASTAAKPSAYTVRRGDTLTSIAKKHGVKVSELRRWNRLHKDRIQPGDLLHLRPATRVYQVRKGDTLGRIAKREGTTTAEIVRLNPGIDPKKIRVGQSLQVPGGSVDPDSPKVDEIKGDAKPKPPLKGAKRAGGKPSSLEALARTCPALLGRVPKHIGYRRVHRDAAWATAQANYALKRGFDHLLRRHRLAPRVYVLDASRHDLGPTEHRSHQTGRDVDITYYQKTCPRDGCPTRRVKPKQLDPRRQWTLLEYWLEQGDVEMMFVSHDLQKVLYEHAQKRGVAQAKLDEWFQYPRPPGTKEGVIRHWWSHENHIHVRFRSPKGNRRACAPK